jgi:hypothetical protein
LSSWSGLSREGSYEAQGIDRAMDGAVVNLATAAAAQTIVGSFPEKPVQDDKWARAVRKMSDK